MGRGGRGLREFGHLLVLAEFKLAVAELVSLGAGRRGRGFRIGGSPARCLGRVRLVIKYAVAEFRSGRRTGFGGRLRVGGLVPLLLAGILLEIELTVAEAVSRTLGGLGRGFGELGGGDLLAELELAVAEVLLAILLHIAFLVLDQIRRRPREFRLFREFGEFEHAVAEFRSGVRGGRGRGFRIGGDPARCLGRVRLVIKHAEVELRSGGRPVERRRGFRKGGRFGSGLCRRFRKIKHAFGEPALAVFRQTGRAADAVFGMRRVQLAVTVVGRALRVDRRAGHRILDRAFLVVLLELVGFLLEDIIRHGHADHLAVADRGRLREQAALLGVQFPVFLAHDRAARKGVYTERCEVAVHLHPPDHEDDGEDQIGAGAQGIDIIHAHITLHLERERLGDGFPAHVHIVIESALLDVLKFILLGKAVHLSAREIKDPLHPQHEVEVGADPASLII